MSDSGSVTMRAYDVLRDDRLLRDKYATPSDVLEYLKNSGDFKTLSDNLKETMETCGICKKGSSDNAYIDALYLRLNKLELSIPAAGPELVGISPYLDGHIKSIFKKTATARETVKRWITGNTRRTGDYNTLVRICFALELELDDATEFLNKSGFNGFNIRNPLDAIYIYSILNKRPFCAALDIFLRYLHAPVNAQDSEQDNRAVYEGSGTTHHMENVILKNSSWESDEAFLTTFLIPNRKSFTEYSKNAYAEYEKIKNPFFLTAVKISVEAEEYDTRQKLVNDYRRRTHKRRYGELLDSDVKRTSTKISYKMKTTLKNHAAGDIFIKKMYDALDFRAALINGDEIAINNLPLICDMIGEHMKKNRSDRQVQFKLGQFLSDVISGDYCFFQLIPSLIGDDSRKKAYKKSDLSNTVLFLFPHRQTLASYEKHPATAGNGVYIRKAIILMYYFAFAYGYLADGSKSAYFADMLSEYSFFTFIEEVNAVLARCRFAPLYPANRFDWLILRSVRQFEVFEPDEDADKAMAIENCISFFDDVLEASFTKED